MVAVTETVIKDLLAKVGEGTVHPDEFRALLQNDDFKEAIRNIKRSDLLPLMFKINGQPYSLDDYPQFKAMYDELYVPELIFLCGRQVSKSTNLSRYSVMNCLQIPHYQVLYLAPLQSQAHRFSTLYLRESINTCPFARHLQNYKEAAADAGPIMKAVGHQSFANGAGIQLTYAKTSADRARGIFCDELDCDELQDQLVDNLGIIMQSLTQSQWGLRRYTGTAKTLDNTIEYYWQQSSMAEWCVRCSCGHWNIPTQEGKVLDMIQVQGPSCVKCGKRLNVLTGQWVHSKPDLSKKFVGYHIPQIMVPAITENTRKWLDLVDKVGRQPIAQVYQEILGISSSLGARLITKEDIVKQSVLPNVNELQKRIKDYPITVGGIDWGIAEQQSFTVHTIVGVRTDGKLHVLWAKRYVGFDTDTMLKDIAQTHRFYRCRLLCADFGVGFTQNTLLSNRFGLPLIQIQYVRQNQLMAYRPLLGYPRWTVDKVTALELMFFAIRYGHIAFPPVEEFERYTADLLSPYQEVREERGIENIAFTRNPNMPDDFAHALTFAVLGATRISGNSLIDILPHGAMGADSNGSAVPIPDVIDTEEIMRPA
jgi:hypothetical protein